MPPENPFMRLFGASPVRPLQRHMAKVVECVSQLAPLFQAVVGADHDEVARIQERIGALENEADALKHELRLHLPRGLFLPVARRDLLEVLSMQDEIANVAKDIAGLVRGRRMALPEPISARFVELVQRSIDACAQAQSAINEFDELVETGFGGGEMQLVQKMLSELDRIEKETDRIQIDVRARLFAVERELPPVDVMFLYQLIDLTGDIGDRAQRVGSRLQIMVAG